MYMSAHACLHCKDLQNCCMHERFVLLQVARVIKGCMHCLVLFVSASRLPASPAVASLEVSSYFAGQLDV